MNIAFEDAQALKQWYEQFSQEPERVTLPGVPYSYYEIVRELLRRDRIEGIMEDLKNE